MVAVDLVDDLIIGCRFLAVVRLGIELREEVVEVGAIDQREHIDPARVEATLPPDECGNTAGVHAGELKLGREEKRYV